MSVSLNRKAACNSCLAVTSGSKISDKDRVFSWKDFDHINVNAKNPVLKYQLETNDIVKTDESSTDVSLAIGLKYHQSMNLCNKLGGIIPKSDNKEEYDLMMKQMVQVKHKIGKIDCSSRYHWLPIIQDASDGFEEKITPDHMNTYKYTWVFDKLNSLKRESNGNQQRPSYLPFTGGQPNGVHLQRCIGTSPSDNKLSGKAYFIN